MSGLQNLHLNQIYLPSCWETLLISFASWLLHAIHWCALLQRHPSGHQTFLSSFSHLDNDYCIILMLNSSINIGRTFYNIVQTPFQSYLASSACNSNNWESIAITSAPVALFGLSNHHLYHRSSFSAWFWTQSFGWYHQNERSISGFISCFINGPHWAQFQQLGFSTLHLGFTLSPSQLASNQTVDVSWFVPLYGDIFNVSITRTCTKLAVRTCKCE